MIHVYRSNNSSTDLKKLQPSHMNSFHFGTPETSRQSFVIKNSIDVMKHFRTGSVENSMMQTKENFHKLVASGHLRAQSYEKTHNSASSIDSTDKRAAQGWDTMTSKQHLENLKSCIL